MFVDKPKGLHTRPKRRRDKENPYDIFIVDSEPGSECYIVCFRNGMYQGQWLYINADIYAALDQFEKDDICYMNEIERHRAEQDDVFDILEWHTTEEQASVEDAVIRNLQWQQVEELLNNLPKKQRHRIILRYVYGLTYKEIAMVEKCSVSSVNRSVLAGLRNLNAWLQDAL